ELRRPEAGQRLRLVAAGEQCELFRIIRADFREPVTRRGDRFVPFDLAKFTTAALADPHQRLAQFRRRLLVHDARGALAAEAAAVYRGRGFPPDMADGTVLELLFDPAPPGAHIESGVFALVRPRRGRLDDLARPPVIAPAFPPACTVQPGFAHSVLSFLGSSA